MSPTPIHLPELYGRSRFLHSLYDRVGRFLTVPGACLLWAVAQAGFFATLCRQQGTLFPTGNHQRMTLAEDTTALSYFFLLPLCFLLLWYSLHVFERFLNHLHSSLEAASLPAAHAELIEIGRRSFLPERLRLPRRFLTTLGIILFSYNLVANLHPESFYGRAEKWDGIAFPVSFAISRLYVFLVWVCLIPVWMSEVYAQLEAMVRINRRMANAGWLRVSPCAPDRFGGMSGMADAASWVGYLFIAGGLFFLAPLLRSVVWGLPLHIGNYVGLGLYALLAVTGAAVPVYLLHRLLDRKKQEVIGFLAEAIDSMNARVMGLIRENNVNALGDEGLSRAMDAMHRQYEQWAALPVWPLNVLFFAKVAVAIGSPVALLVFQYVTGRMTS